MSPMIRSEFGEYRQRLDECIGLLSPFEVEPTGKAALEQEKQNERRGASPPSFGRFTARGLDANRRANRRIGRFRTPVFKIAQQKARM
jgi:hypothetical protein